MTISVNTSKICEAIKNQPLLIKDEQIIDAISGIHVYCQLNKPYLVPVFGMDGFVHSSSMGLALTTTRIILYYEDEEQNHQFRIYPIEDIENITLEVDGWINKSNNVKLYMGGSYAIMQIQLGETPDEFIKNVKNCMSLKNNQIESKDIGNDLFIYCIKCGTKLPNEALFCMKCGANLKNLHL